MLWYRTEPYNKGVQGYCDILKRQYPGKRVHANVVYQQYIGDKEHLHMNATCWVTLTSFVKHLGRTGKCVIDETEKGWFVTWVEKDMEQMEYEKRWDWISLECFGSGSVCFFGLPDPHPDPLVTSTDPDPDPSLFSLKCWSLLNNGCKIKKYLKNWFFCVLKVTEDFGTDPDPLVRGKDTRIIPDPRPEPYQNVTDPEHWTMSQTLAYGKVPQFGLRIRSAMFAPIQIHFWCDEDIIPILYLCTLLASFFEYSVTNICFFTSPLPELLFGVPDSHQNS